jgi:hypothetical protein
MPINYALLADHAEVINGKLYLMGGGLDTFSAPRAPARVRFAVALGVLVGWDETNLPIALRLQLEDDDGGLVLALDGQLQVGRPPHLPAGASQLAQAAVIIEAELAAFGGYRVVVSATCAGGEEDRRTLPFRLAPSAGSGLPPAEARPPA